MNDVDARLCLVLIEKLREVDAMDLNLVREYIKEIKTLLARAALALGETE